MPVESSPNWPHVDPHVVVINHSRNFGSQNAFTSGMKLATGDAVILLDGDLQDPPELIEAFFEKWLEGFDVVYGIRVKREATRFLQVAYKAFYPRLQGLVLCTGAIGCWRLLADRSAGRGFAQLAAREQSIPEGLASLGGLPTDRGPVPATGADVRYQHEFLAATTWAGLARRSSRSRTRHWI